MNACDHPWWIEGDYTDATCKACGVPGWYCPACSPDPDDDADEDCTTCGGSGYVVVHELIARLTRELEEARRERSAARAEAMTAQASLRRAKRELEAAREREKRRELAVRFIECAIGWLHSDDCDLLTTDDGDLREAVCELRNALDLLATPPAEGGSDAGE